MGRKDITGSELLNEPLHGVVMRAFQQTNFQMLSISDIVTDVKRIDPGASPKS